MVFDVIGAGIEGLVDTAHATAVGKGWWSKEEADINKIVEQYGLSDDVRTELRKRFGTRSFVECLGLVDSEVAEAIEDYRVNGLDPEKFLYLDENGKPCGIASELADVLIRVADLCGMHDIPLAEGVEAKLTYNASRPVRHGGKNA